MISTRDLSKMPDVDNLRRLLQAVAMVEAVLCPNWESRYYSFNAAWSSGEQMGSMRNGSGDDFFAHFGPAGCWLKGFAHESPMSPYRARPPRAWPGVLDQVPVEFGDCLAEKAFEAQAATFCIWRRPTDAGWQRGKIAFPPAHEDPDGSGRLLSILDGRPDTYRAWASDYYDRKIKSTAVEHVYRLRPLTPAVVAALNPDASWDELAADIKEIGYPVG